MRLVAVASACETARPSIDRFSSGGSTPHPDKENQQQAQVLGACSARSGPQSRLPQYVLKISKLGRSRRWREAVETLVGMSALGEQPNTYIYNAVAGAISRVGAGAGGLPRKLHSAVSAWRGAAALMHAMAAVAVELDEVTCISCVGACRLSHRWRNAAVAMDHLRSGGVELGSVPVNSQLSTLEKCGEWRKCVALLGALFHEALRPDEGTLVPVLGACGKSMHWERSLAVVLQAELGAHCLPTNAYNAAIDACCNQGKRWYTITAMCEDMLATAVRVDRVTFNTLVNAGGKALRWDSSLLSLRAMLHAGVEVSDVACNAAMASCQRGGEWRLAVRCLQMMRFAHLELGVITHSTVVSALASDMLWDKSLRVMDEMWRNEADPNVVTFSAAVGSLEEGEHWECAVGLLATMRARRVAPNDFTYNTAITACEKSTQCEQALRLMRSIKRDAAVRADLVTYNAMLSASEKAGRWAQAKLILEELRQRGDAPDCLSFGASISACEAQLPERRWVQALLLLQKARLALLETTRVMCNAAMNSAEKSQQWELAQSLFGEAYARGLGGDQTSYETAYGTCALAFSAARLWANVIGMAHMMAARDITMNTDLISSVLMECEDHDLPINERSLFRNLGVIP